MTELHVAVAALVVGLSTVVVLLALIAGRRSIRRRRAVAASPEGTPVRRAARPRPTVPPPGGPAMYWVPDTLHGGWRLAGHYLPATEDGTPVNRPPRRRPRIR